MKKQSSHKIIKTETHVIGGIKFVFSLLKGVETEFAPAPILFQIFGDFVPFYWDSRPESGSLQEAFKECFCECFCDSSNESGKSDASGEFFDKSGELFRELLRAFQNFRYEIQLIEKDVILAFEYLSLYPYVVEWTEAKGRRCKTYHTDLDKAKEQFYSEVAGL